MDNRTKEIITQVAFKAVVEIYKTQKKPYELFDNERDHIENCTRVYTQMLIDLVNEFTESKPLGASHKHELKQLVESSILDEEQEAAAYRAIEDVKSMKGYEELKTKLLNHQRESNNLSAKEIGEKVKDKANDPNS